ncbi:MAG: glycosyltransferase [Kiritimatiellae bacterium]|nr:glycosyltransferase [Kiritimatiellia bacterium]
MATEENNKKWESALSLLGGGGMLSVVMPAYQLASSIGENIDTVVRVLDGNIPFEIVPVDDGSTDGTADALRAAVSRHPGVVKPVVLEKNAGKGNALKRGFDASSGNYVMLLDADLDLSPAGIPLFFDVMREKKASIVIGSKRHRDSQVEYPWHRRLASFVYYSLVRLLVGLPVSDTQTGMKLFVREALQWSFERMLVKRFAFDLEVLSIANNRGYRVAEAPVTLHFGEKVGCLSLSNIRDVLTDTLAIFYRQRILHYYRNVEVAPPSEHPIRVSVVIACPGGSAYLDEALRGLDVQTYRAFEVLVLPDEPLELSPRSFPLRVIPTGKVRPAEKRNLGIREATGEVVAFLDDDAWPVPNWLECAVKYFTLPDVGGVGGPGTTPPNDPFAAKLSGRVFENPLVSGNYRYRYRGDRVRGSVDDYPSCNLFVRKDVLEEIGGYNTRYWPGEDTILCSDIVFRAKRRIVYDPWAQVYHHRRALFLPHLRQVGRYGLHRGYFAKRFPKTSLRPGYLVPTLFVCGLVAGAALSFVHPWLFYAYCAVTGLYALTVLLTTFSLNPIVWMLSAAGVFLTHVWYGIRFAQGLCSRRMPCEVASFDHGPQQG